MYALEIVPLGQSNVFEYLTYFSSKVFEVGSLVEIDIGKKKSFGVIFGIQNALDLKTEIKTKDFYLRKIKSGLVAKLFDQDFKNFFENFCVKYAYNISFSLSKIFPPEVLEKIISNGFKYDLSSTPNTKRKFIFDTNEIRTKFLTEEGCICVAPNKHACEQIARFFDKKSIVYDLQTTLSNTSQIITLPKFAFYLMFALKKNIFLDFESDLHYKSFAVDFFDYSLFFREFGIFSSKVILGDVFPRIENQSTETGDYFKTYKNSNKNIMVYHNHKTLDFSNEVISEMKKVISTNGNIFVYTNYPLLAKRTICNDCHSIVSCENCGHELGLYEKKKKRFYKCMSCSKKYDLFKTCANCGSWKLTVFGFSEESIYMELSAKFKDTFILKNVRRDISIKNEKLLSKKGSKIIISDNLFFSKINFDLVVLPNADQYLASNDYRAYDNFKIIIGKLLELGGQIAIQSTNLKFAENLIGKDYEKTRVLEIDSRESLGFPPKHRIFKIITQNTKNSFREQKFENAILSKDGKILGKSRSKTKVAYLVSVKNDSNIDINRGLRYIFSDDLVSVEAYPTILFGA